MSPLNPFADSEIACRYESWYHAKGYESAQQEKKLITYLLDQFTGVRRILDVGSGTGYFTRWFEISGYHPVGIDSSVNMLKEAKKERTPEYVQGSALSLPFESQSFDIAVMITALEFLYDPKKAIREMARIAKKGFVIGAINKYSLVGLKYRLMGGSIWNAAKFYSPSELQMMILSVVPNEPKIIWKTTLWTAYKGCSHLPWGGFIGMAAIFKL